MAVLAESDSSTTAAQPGALSSCHSNAWLCQQNTRVLRVDPSDVTAQVRLFHATLLANLAAEAVFFLPLDADLKVRSTLNAQEVGKPCIGAGCDRFISERRDR